MFNKYQVYKDKILNKSFVTEAYMRICIGGTFNTLHKGHRVLLDKAFEKAGKNGTVYIGLSEGDLVKKKKYLKPLTERKKALEDYLLSKGYDKQSMIIPIHNKYGITLDEDFDLIIISPETKKIAEEINAKRKSMGKKPILIELVPYVLAKDNKPISSTRILNKEIDREGNLLS